MDRFQNTRQPDWDWWQELWPDPKHVLRRLGVEADQSLADIGCGNGYFTLPAAELVQPAPVYAIDLDESLLAEVAVGADEQGFSNIQCIAGDARNLKSLLSELVDIILIANTFHGIEEPTAFAEQAYQRLKPRGQFVIVNWYDRPPEETVVADQPRGPPSELRLSPEETRQLVVSIPFERIDAVDLPPHHYALICER